MNNGIGAYLSRLRQELDGCDPATVQDALADAETHLRLAVDSAVASDSGLSRAAALTAAIEKYGTPEEVAAAYRQIETHTTPSLADKPYDNESSAPAGFFEVIIDPRAWGALVYMLIAMITGIIYFTWAMSGLSISLSMLILVIGIPVAGLFLHSIRGIALVEGRIVEALLGVRMPRRPSATRKVIGWWGHFKSLLASSHTWKVVGYMLLQLPLGILYFTITITMLALSLGLLGRPILEDTFDLPIVLGHTAFFTPGWLMPVVVFLGLIVGVATMHVARWLGRMHGSIARAMLLEK